MATGILLTLDQTRQIGEALHDHWEKIAGAAPMPRDDTGWGDVAQFVIRKANALDDAEDTKVDQP